MRSLLCISKSLFKLKAKFIKFDLNIGKNKMNYSKFSRRPIYFSIYYYIRIFFGFFFSIIINFLKNTPLLKLFSKSGSSKWESKIYYAKNWIVNT